MEEEVTQRTIALSIRTAKLTGNVLRAALRKFLAAQYQKGKNPYKQGKQTDTLTMKSMREELKAVERLRKTAGQLSRQERNKSHDREPER